MKQSSLHAIALLFSTDLTTLKSYHADLFIIALQFVLIFDEFEGEMKNWAAKERKQAFPL